MNKYVFRGGPAFGVKIQTDAVIEGRLYYNGSLYWVLPEVDDSGYQILKYERIVTRGINEIQD